MQDITRFYTEEKNVQGIKELVMKYFEGATIYKGSSISKEWGQEESIIAEVISSREMRAEDITGLCEDIKILNDQQAVYVVRINSNGVNAYLI
jgi:hypothetical protein